MNTIALFSPGFMEESAETAKKVQATIEAYFHRKLKVFCDPIAVYADPTFSRMSRENQLKARAHTLLDYLCNPDISIIWCFRG